MKAMILHENCKLIFLWSVKWEKSSPKNVSELIIAVVILNCLLNVCHSIRKIAVCDAKLVGLIERQ